MARELRNVPVTIMFTATDAARIQAAADQQGKAKSEYGRDVILRELEGRGKVQVLTRGEAARQMDISDITRYEASLPQEQ